MSGEKKNIFVVKWRIENIRPWLQSKDDYLCSPSFLVKTMKNTTWKLKLLRKWRLVENCISLALQRDIDDHSDQIFLNYELSFLAHDGSPLKLKTCKSKFAQKTVSQELKVMGQEIFGEKDYLPEGVLTVCCKLWKDLSTILMGEQCSIRSVIGRKCVTLNGIINYFSTLANSNVTLNFMSPSEDIFISFDVEIKGEGDFIRFERTGLECKCFSWYSCKLFHSHFSATETENLAKLLSPHKTCSFETCWFYSSFKKSPSLKNDEFTLQLEISYFPGVESEYIEYDYNNFKKQSADLENVSSNLEDENSSKLDTLCQTETEDETCDNQKNDSDEENECLETTRKRPSTVFKEASLYNDRLFCDIKLRTDTETFPAHRCVLSARSPVFTKMFTSDMKEKAGECINVPDISSDTVRRMLQFIYTDCPGDLDMQSAKDLYIASDKYDIASLKQRCTSFMKKYLCTVNVCEVLALADMHKDKNLESAAQEYVLTNEEEVFYSDEWKLFMKNYACLAAQVMYLKITKS